MTAVTVVWIVFALGVAALILYAAGVFGGSSGTANGNGNGTEVTQEQSTDGSGGGNAAAADGDQDAEQDADQDAELDAEQEAENGEDGETQAADDAGDDGASAEPAEASVFTAGQAERGQEAFAQNCAQCHGGQLDGNPPLTGSTFAGTWDGMPVNALYEVISQTMPLDNPGSLDPETYADITAHILAFNGMPEGEDELGPDDAQALQVLITTGDSGEAGSEGQDETGDEAASGDQDEAAGTDTGDGTDGEAATDGGEQAEQDAGGEDGADGESQEAADDDGMQTVEVSEPGEGEQPGAGEGWIRLTVQPGSATVNILGPDGYVGRTSGEGTLTGLEPGNYVLTAALGNFSHRMDAEVRPREITPVNLVIGALASSEDAQAGGQQGEQGQGNGGQAGQDDGSENGAGDTGGENGAGNGADGDEGNGEDARGEDANGDNGDNGADGDSSDGNDGNGNGGDDAWYTEEQAGTGAEDYSASCASCHGEDGNGNPPLADGAIEGSFGTVWELFDYTSSEMPQDAPGSLDEETYVNIVAHMLAMNDYEAGDEELEADEDAMSDMELGGDGSSGEDTAEGDGASGEEQDGGTEADTAAGRGAAAYSSSCAMCHGPTLAGVSAPPLAGPVFMERWGGHPVDWLYFQAHTSMPPDAPGSLDDQAYVDIIVYVLSENGILDGTEEFHPDQPEFIGIVIGSDMTQDQELEQRINELRRQLHQPFGDEEGETESSTTPSPARPLTSDAEPVTPDTPIGEPGEAGTDEGTDADTGTEGEDAGTEGEGQAGPEIDEAMIDAPDEEIPAGGGGGEGGAAGDEDNGGEQE